MGYTKSHAYVLTTMSDQVKHWHVTYNDIHNLIRKCTPNIVAQYNPDLLIAIGGGSVSLSS
jgi:hypoxanthine phosphoribosyltransferase